jgi:hypothetical protein
MWRRKQRDGWPGNPSSMRSLCASDCRLHGDKGKTGECRLLASQGHDELIACFRSTLFQMDIVCHSPSVQACPHYLPVDVVAASECRSIHRSSSETGPSGLILSADATVQTYNVSFIQRFDASRWRVTNQSKATASLSRKPFSGWDSFLSLQKKRTLGYIDTRLVRA